MIKLVRRNAHRRWVFRISSLDEVEPLLGSPTAREIVAMAAQRGLPIDVWEDSHIAIFLSDGWGIRLDSGTAQKTGDVTRASWTDSRGKVIKSCPVSDAYVRVQHSRPLVAA